jgi:hypothetical protein
MASSLLSSSPCPTTPTRAQQQVATTIATAISPATKKASKNALEAVIMVAARDVIELKKAKKMYGAYKAMLRRYDNGYGRDIEQWQEVL